MTEVWFYHLQRRPLERALPPLIEEFCAQGSRLIVQAGSEERLDALVKEAEKAGRAPSLYIQVNIGEEEQKGGCAIDEIGARVEAVRASLLLVPQAVRVLTYRPQ